MKQRKLSKVSKSPKRISDNTNEMIICETKLQQLSVLCVTLPTVTVLCQLYTDHKKHLERHKGTIVLIKLQVVYLFLVATVYLISVGLVF